MGRSPARLVIALSVAAVLAVFILYTAIAGNATAQLSPSQLQHAAGRVGLVGTVVGRVTGDAHSARGLRFAMRDVSGKATARVRVVYHGSVPDLFRTGRHVVLMGRLHDGVFVGEAGSLITKCPSKYAPAKPSSNT
ncbi:MAG: cytochrome c maturation protein CcmE domain-containing protein [Gaiellaceae bacterium]